MIDSPRRRGAARLRSTRLEQIMAVGSRRVSHRRISLVLFHCAASARHSMAWRFSWFQFFPCADTIKRPLHRLETRLIAKRARERREEGCKNTRPPGFSRERREIKLNLQLRGILRCNSLLTPRERTELSLACWALAQSSVDISNAFKYINPLFRAVILLIFYWFTVGYLRNECANWSKSPQMKELSRNLSNSKC